MMKIYLPAKLFKTLFLGLYFLVFALWANAGTYYSNNANLSSVNNWWSNTNGTGTHPANFTTSGDFFILQTAQTWTTGGNLTIGVGVTLQIDGILSING